MRDRLDRMIRDMTMWNMKALLFKSNDLSIICNNLNKILNLIDNKSQNASGELRKLFKDTFILLDKFILQDMSYFVQCMQECECDPSSIFTHYIFRDELYFIKEECEKLNIQYESKVIKLEQKYNMQKELAF